CFSISFIAVFIIGSFRVLYKLPVNFENYGTLKITYIGLTIFTFIFSYFGIKQPIIFGDNIKNKIFDNNKIKDNSTEITSPDKYKRSGLKDKDAERYFKDLLRIMDTEKPYLNEKLSIQDLSDILGISRHYLTQVINEKLHKNFYTFTNEYRLKEVKKRMLSDKYKNYTILSIALESGFNSKSTFNTLFKNYTGMTPSEYRKKNLLM
ncbi:MAG: helix-turn-helix transcriptional regulator, partial [Bacteroidales bacterium]|nr:helix-turn-helix transcriptional regulator [Bacteroidales bacterium]